MAKFGFQTINASRVQKPIGKSIHAKEVALFKSLELDNFIQFKNLLNEITRVKKIDNIREENLHFTILHRAVWSARTEFVKFLIEKGANVNVKDMEGRVPLRWAIFQRSTIYREAMLKIAEMLIRAGANINYKTPSNGKTALMFAAYLGDVEAVDLLGNYCADVTKKDKEGQTAKEIALTKLKDTPLGPKYWDYRKIIELLDFYSRG